MTLTQRDAESIWHPYTQQLNARPPLPVLSGKGAYLYDEEGCRYIDAVSSWWVTLHGHSHPYIVERVTAQLQQLDQVIFAGFTHEPAIALAENLLAILPEGQKKVFYTDNGSTAVEVALKMCVQYWFNKGKSRKKVLAFNNGYHGDTFGAMSVSGRSAWTAPFDNLLFEVIFIDTPTEENLPVLKEIISVHAAELACFVYEPLVQGSAGMLMYEAPALDQLMAHCLEEGVLMIQDEVFTGFGRTGKNFAADHLKTQPDVMCFSKGLTGGTMPLGVTTCTEDIYNAFLSEDKLKTLFHGHSFTANPLACTAALASIELLLQHEAQDNIRRICNRHAEFSLKICGHQKVAAVRQTGTIIAIEWQTESGTSYFSKLRNLLYDYFMDKGILMRPLGNVIYILPPYCISDEDLKKIYQEIQNALEIF
ncbi:adenosylmethionine--8-amino-7-oxononanoate transaminase [Pedobacter hartonius]|uniref:Adenosylmethionine-8-amino-7-oxononanoate aminotransferase n=1 Tax=Pedobacter hartonius TaxID=425514 RepID=A0A1H4HE28_9SPHI|nr:adenosylmethionine--8-amino-7-oxononanoate transaminase [Pedobacter hartonius]SEB19955.1 adenosylmethionine-8-amino-7-oxononanoate aminotransferase [Pedobacter hartonius]